MGDDPLVVGGAVFFDLQARIGAGNNFVAGIGVLGAFHSAAFFTELEAGYLFVEFVIGANQGVAGAVVMAGVCRAV